MRILVIDDSSENLTKATEQLEGHELVLVSTYDDAENALKAKLDYLKYTARAHEILGALGFAGGSEAYRNTDKWDAWSAAFKSASQQAKAELTVHPNFDVVLTDLMLPASKRAQRDPSLVGKEMPLGGFLALLAMKAGIKKVAIVTDTNHHDHPASAALDVFDPQHDGAFLVGDTKVVCWNYGKQWEHVLELLNGEKSDD